MNNLDPGVLDNIQFVLCLDSISSSNDNDLYMHISRFPKESEENASRLYKVSIIINKNYLDFQCYFWKHEYEFKLY